MTADVFILTGLNPYEWAALAGSSATICAAAIWTHRRDMRRHRRNHPSHRS